MTDEPLAPHNSRAGTSTRSNGLRVAVHRTRMKYQRAHAAGSSAFWIGLVVGGLLVALALALALA